MTYKNEKEHQLKSILQSKNATMFIFKTKGQFNHGLFRKSIRQSSY